MLVSGTLNVVIERLAYRRLRHAPRLAPLITAIGVWFILHILGRSGAGSTTASPDLIGSQSDYFTRQGHLLSLTRISS